LIKIKKAAFKQAAFFYLYSIRKSEPTRG